MYRQIHVERIMTVQRAQAPFRFHETGGQREYRLRHCLAGGKGVGSAMNL